MVVDLYNAMLQEVDFKKLKGGGGDMAFFLNIYLHIIVDYLIVFLTITNTSVV